MRPPQLCTPGTPGPGAGVTLLWQWGAKGGHGASAVCGAGPLHWTAQCPHCDPRASVPGEPGLHVRARGALVWVLGSAGCSSPYPLGATSAASPARAQTPPQHQGSGCRGPKNVDTPVHHSHPCPCPPGVPVAPPAWCSPSSSSRPVPLQHTPSHELSCAGLSPGSHAASIKPSLIFQSPCAP